MVKRGYIVDVMPIQLYCSQKTRCRGAKIIYQQVLRLNNKKIVMNFKILKLISSFPSNSIWMQILFAFWMNLTDFVFSSTMDLLHTLEQILQIIHKISFNNIWATNHHQFFPQWKRAETFGALRHQAKIRIDSIYQSIFFCEQEMRAFIIYANSKL